MSFGIGILAGALGALVGLGGGVVMIPLLTGWLGFSQHQAQGPSLLALMFTGLAGAVAYGANRSVDWPAAALLVLPAMLMAWVGARSCNRLPERNLRRLFSAFLIAISALMLLKPFLHPAASGAASVGFEAGVLVVTGLVTGFLSGLFGIGGGAIVIAAMVLVLGYGQHPAQGSALVAMVPVAAVGAWCYRDFGRADAGVLKGLVPGILLGAAGGAQLAHLFPDAALRIIFAVVLAGTGLQGLRAKVGEASCRASGGRAG
jgi:uncharacterized membrane protein YfcA